MDGVIAGYPEGGEPVVVIAEPVVKVKDGAVKVTATIDFAGGYSQDYKIRLD